MFWYFLLTLTFVDVLDFLECLGKFSDVSGSFSGVFGHFGMFWDVLDDFGMFWDILDVLVVFLVVLGCFGTLCFF